MDSMPVFLLTRGLNKALIVNKEIIEFDILGNCNNPNSIRVYRPFLDTGTLSSVSVISCLQVTGYSEIEIFCILNNLVYRDIIISAEKYEFLKQFFIKEFRAKVLRISGVNEGNNYRQTFYVFEQLNISHDIILKVIQN